MNEQKAYTEFDRFLKKWTSTTIGRKQFLAAVPLLLAACGGTGTNNRMREGDNTGQKTSLTVEDEKKLTQEVLAEMKKDYPPIQDSELQSYIQSLGDRIVNSNNLNNNPYSYNFTVVGVGYVNAFALPAGTVFVTAPLIAMTDTEAELAGVVGHEIGHIQARHTAERMEAAKEAEGSLMNYLLTGGGIGGIIGLAAGAKLCPPKDTACIAKAAVMGASAGAAAGFLVQKYKFMANSREDEMEADRIGFKTAVGAGFSKAHVGKFYEKLLAMEQEARKGQNPLLTSLSDAMSTHPPSKERVNQMNEMVRNSTKTGGEISGANFPRIKSLCTEWTNSKKG
jgi:predicted Zn-dependent protease